MKLIKVILLLAFLFQLTLSSAERKPMNINFKNLQIEDLVKITSKILNKNILLSHKIPGNVDFLSNTEVYEDDILNILIYVLSEKGFTLVDNNGILRVVRLGEASKYNLPVYSNKTKSTFSMVTNVFELKDLNVDYVASKIVHLIGKSARVVTDKKSNSLIVTDFIDNIKTIKKVIDYLSKDNLKEVEMIPLEYTKTETVSIELRNLAKSVFDITIENQKVEILVNKDTNSIILVGKPQNNQVLKNYIKKIDIKGSLAESVTEVIGLKNTEAKSILTLLNAILGKKVYKDPEAKPFVAVDEETNTVVIMGPKSEVNSIKELIDKLDIDRPQVYVKAQIIEINDNKAQDIGVAYGIGAGAGGSDGLITMSSNLNKGTMIADLNTTILSKITTSIPDLTAGLALGATVNLLKSNDAAETISEPSILAINNKESKIYVGERRSIKTSTTTTDGGNINDNYSREDIGLTLTVKPRISNGDKVILEVETLLEGVLSGGEGDQPTTTKKEVNTTAIVNNGQSIILGGLIQNKNSTESYKVPILGDIPVLGQLFSNDSDANNKVSLVVILTPYIVSKSVDLAEIRRYLAELSQIEQQVINDLELRKLKNKIKEKEQDKERKEKLKELKEEIKDLEEEQKEKETSTNDEHRHPEYIREMLNL